MKCEKATVLVLIPIVANGGAEQSTALLVENLSCNFNFVVVSGLATNEKLLERLKPKYQLSGLFNESKSLLVALVKTIQKIYRVRQIIINSSPRIVISIEKTTSIVARIAAFGEPVPIVAVEHSNPRFHGGSKLWSLLRSVVYPRISRVVCVSEGIASEFSWLPSMNVATIYNPALSSELIVKAKSSIPLIQDEYFCYVGRFSHEKNVKFLIECYGYLVRNGVSIKLVLVGDGGLRNELEDLVATLGLNDYVLFMGVRSDALKIIANSKFLALCSFTEGFPLVLLEALSCGVPVISFDCDYGPREIINSSNGILVPMHDRVKYIEGLDLLVNDQHMYSNFKKNSRKSVSKFDGSIVYQQWTNLINVLIKQDGE